MRAWQLWHFDDADIHIPEHKGKEMKKPLTPLSVPRSSTPTTDYLPQAMSTAASKTHNSKTNK